MDDPFETPIRTNLVLLNAVEVAKVLHISPSKAYKLMQTGEIRTVHMCRTVRVRPEDLDEFIQRALEGRNRQA